MFAYNIKKTLDSPFFPNPNLRISNILIREYVGRENLFEYITKHGFPYNLSNEIIDLIKDLKRLKFKKINIGNAHIFVNFNDKIMVIDPRKPFTKITSYILILILNITLN